MAAQTQLFYIGTSKAKEIRGGASVTYDWGSYGSWTKFKSPSAASKKKVKYNKNTKNKAGSSTYAGAGGVTKCGTSIPATASRTVSISGVDTTISAAVRYYVRGYTIYTRPKELKKKKKMYRTSYTTAKPYQYLLQYKDKAVKSATYSTYTNGMEYIFFDSYYYDDSGNQIETSGHLPHPTECGVTYSDVRRNISTDNTNNSDGRDNSGTYVMSNVRANVVTLSLKWEGLGDDEGADLLDTLNPTKNSKGQYDFLTVQYRDPATGKYKNGTFYASERSVTKYSNGYFKEISVTLTEV